MPPSQCSTERKDANVDGRSTSSLGQQDQLQLARDYPNKNPYDTKPGEKPYKMEIVWFAAFKLTYAHVACLIAYSYGFSFREALFGFMVGYISALGITAGSHRYWAHKSYKVKRPLFYILLFLQTISVQNSVIEWVRDHRVHHKYSDTNADPHNATRGFFFSHIGWLVCKKHPDVKKYGQRIDLSDLTSDPVLRFQKKYYEPLAVFCGFLLPAFLSMYIFDQSFSMAYHHQFGRFIVQLHSTSTINSINHLWGSKPFDKDIKPTENWFTGLIAMGEGWHNYHHVFPFDYRVSELPRYWCNVSLAFIDFFARMGWAYDLKTVPDDIVRRRVLRTGDGSHQYSKEENNKTAKELEEDERHRQNDEHIRDHYWGWGDEDMLPEDIDGTMTINPKGNRQQDRNEMPFLSKEFRMYF